MRFFVAILLLTLLQAVSFAQTGAAEVTGEVRDSAGALILSARIDILQISTAQTTTIEITDGSYSISNLKPGIYNLTITATGFKQVMREGVRLTTGERIRVDFELAPGGLSELVVIRDDAPLLRTETGSLGQVIGQRKIVDLPTDVTQVFNAISIQHVRHSIKTGIDFRWERLNVIQPPSPTGQFRFSTLFTNSQAIPAFGSALAPFTGNSLASFLLGTPGFGSITSAGDPRVIQVGAKFNF